MTRRHNSTTELGMMVGIVAGAAVFAIMLAITGSVLWIIAVGAGVALGLGVGASLDARKGHGGDSTA